MTIFLKRYKYFLCIFVLLFIPTLFLFRENTGRAVLLLSSFFFWLVYGIYSKNFVKSSLLYILLTLPFNITFQLPTTVLIFGSNITLADPFVNGVYVNYLVPTLSILDIGILFLLCSFVLNGKFRIKKKLLIPILIFFSFIIIQYIYTGVFLSLFTSLRLLAYIYVSILSLVYLKKPSFSTIYIFIFLVLCQGVIGLLQFLQGSSLGLSFLGESQVVSGMQGSSFVTLGNELFLRAYGTFPHPNMLGGFLLMCLLIGIFYLHISKNSKEKFLSLLLIFLSALFSIFTFSRIIWFLVGICIVVLFLHSMKGKIFSFSLPFFFERFFNLFTGGDSGLNDRVKLVVSWFRVFKENLLMGVGAGNFVKGMEEYVPRTSNGILLLQPVHNVLLLILGELGILGGFSFLYLILSVVREYLGKLNWFKVLILGCILVICMFDHYMFTLPQGLGMVFVLGIYMTNFEKKK